MLAFFKSRFAAITARAHHAATSPKNDLPQPTEGQKKAGNYKKGHITVQGLGITIENPAGSVRTGLGRDGKIWRTTMRHHYGYLKRTVGADEDHVDCFLGEHPESELVFVVDQVDPETGEFDEAKCILGARSEAEARAIYRANYPDTWRGLGAITALPIAEFKEWLEHHDTRAPLAMQKLPPRLVFSKNVSGDVENPGSRGGTFYIDAQGKVRYGVPPPGTTRTLEHGASTRRQRPTFLRRTGFHYRGRQVRSAEDAALIFRSVTDLDRERLYALHLDAESKPIAVECISQGTVNSTPGQAREILRNAAHLDTAKMILIHNHPSGMPMPSRGDYDAGLTLAAVASQMNIDVVSQIVVGREGYATLDVRGGIGEMFTWPSTGSTARSGRTIPGLEGRVDVVDHGTPWNDLFGAGIHGPLPAAQLGRLLLDPEDRIALLLGLDTRERLTGVFPFAHDQLDDEAVRRVVNIAVKGGATTAVFVAGEDGPAWKDQIERSVALLIGAVQATGTEVHDFLVVGDDAAWSAVPRARS